MRLQRLFPALAAAAMIGPAGAVDLVSVYRDAQVSDPVYQSNRAIYEATVERLPPGLQAMPARGARLFQSFGYS